MPLPVNPNGSTNATTATKAYGSQFYYSTDGSSYTKIGQTVDLGSPEPEVGDVKITNNDSPADTHEYLPGMIEGGTYEVTIVHTAAITNTVFGLMDASTIYYWKSSFPDGSYWKFKGYPKKIKEEGKTDDGAIETKFTIKVTALPGFYQS